MKFTSDLNARDLVISPMAVGIFNFPLEKAAEATVKTFVEYVKENNTPFQRIRFIVSELDHVGFFNICTYYYII